MMTAGAREYRWGALLVLLLAAGSAGAGQLRGRVVDALDGSGLPGIEVVVEGLEVGTLSGPEGEYLLEVPDGVWRLRARGSGYSPGELANQPAGPATREAVLHLWPKRFPAGFVPGLHTFGRGLGTGVGPAPREGTTGLGSPWLVPVPVRLPDTIRVARYFSSSCSGRYQRIDTIGFEDYVRGVVNAEVGVFRGMAGGPASAAEVWKAFAVAARSYALHFILTQPYDGYDINDTACNQVYKDDRDPDVSAAVDATRGLILVKADAPDLMDRYFYAASCAHHGTEPAYAPGTILPDPTGAHACVGSWCGHDNCAGHADNPELPGEDRCLVWGICQWGSAERSLAGEDFQQILAHYQPNCSLRQLASAATGILKGVVYRVPDLQDWIAGAEVTLEGGPTVIFDGQQPWQFELEPGTYTVHAVAAGYRPGAQTRTVAAGETIWGSIGLEPESDAGGPDGDGGGVDAGGGDGDGIDAGEGDGVDAGDSGADGGGYGEIDAGAESDRTGDEYSGDAARDGGAGLDANSGCGCGSGRGGKPGVLGLLLGLLAAGRRRRPGGRA